MMTTTECSSACRQRCLDLPTSASRFIFSALLLFSFSAQAAHPSDPSSVHSTSASGPQVKSELTSRLGGVVPESGRARAEHLVAPSYKDVPPYGNTSPLDHLVDNMGSKWSQVSANDKAEVRPVISRKSIVMSSRISGITKVVPLVSSSARLADNDSRGTQTAVVRELDVDPPRPVVANVSNSVPLPSVSAPVAISAPLAGSGATPRVVSPDIDRLTDKIATRFKIPTSQARHIVEVVHKEAKVRALDPLVVLSIIATESSFNQNARSKMGAMGLMQAIPSYHQEKFSKLGMSKSDLYVPRLNIRLGTEILSEYLKLSNGNMSLALQRYNGSLSDRSRKYSGKIFQAMSWLSKP